MSSVKTEGKNTMSMKDLEQFYEKVRMSQKLDAEATSALQQGPEALVALGAREGFSFSQAELAAGLEELAAGQELSDKDLDLVAGGSRPNCSDSKPGDSDNFKTSS